ncbi:MAG: hypothetical protein A2X45_22620 [Lentisphaerae bacterium GWF2_50_93]|nr:MAG: hypothetical protein A2X45_22620 [Lentisphaerae bacterium GWF2_50_93]
MTEEVVYSKSEQVRLRILNAIESGKYPVGFCIPSENELVALTGTSRVTVRDAISKLVTKGYLKRIQGKGTMVIKSGSQPRQSSVKSIYIITVSSHAVDLFGNGILAGVHDALSDGEFSVFLKNIPSASDFNAYVEKEIHPENCRGIILSGDLSRKIHVEAVRKKNIPCVSVGIPADGADIPYVEVNHEHGIRMAVDELISKGHKRIAFFDYTLDWGHSPSILAREQGYRNALSAAGIRLDPDLIVRYNVHGPAGREQAIRLIKRELSYSAAVIVGYGFVTDYVMEITAYGLSIPKDLAIINYRGYANFDDKTGLFITCVVQPLHEMGSAAVDLLLGRGRAGGAVYFEPSFIRGQTVSEKPIIPKR